LDTNNKFTLFRHITPSSVASFATTSTAATSTDDEDKVLQAKQKMATIRLYRILQRQIRGMVTPEEQALKNETRSLLLQPLPLPSDWGRHSMFTPPNPSSITLTDLYQLFYNWIDNQDDDVPSPFASSSSSSSPNHTIDDWLSAVLGDGTTESTPVERTCWTTVEQLQQATKHAFSCEYNQNKSMGDQNLPNLHKLAISAIQSLQQQELLWKHSSVCDTHGIRIVASSR
jgi:hypothetical protein